ncbi:hypothetical protein [Candidatus Nanopusillus massiliensis]|uniref:hypothetical protein n=1 Tax=Candidatus Nanopusillus massiliensis TaxID=2897163 RepID=UPI001E3B8635|nr:hypothetical protein [Candidatus Nanopusillus massiliensis]
MGLFLPNFIYDKYFSDYLMNTMNPIEFSGFNFGKFESTSEANNVDNEENTELNVKREKTFSKIFEDHKLTNSIPDKNYPKRLVDIL